MRTARLAPLLMLAIAAAGCDRSPDRAAPVPAPTPAVVRAPIDAAAIAVPVAIDAAPPPGEVLVITPRAPVPGATWIEKFDASLDFDLDFGGAEQITRTKQSKVRRVTVLASDGGRVTRARIAYTKLVTSMIIDGDPRADPSPIRGKTYVVEWKDGDVDVRAPSGRAPSAAEIDEVRKERKSFQRLEAIGLGLAHVRLPIDQPTELPAASFAAATGADQDGLVPERVLVTYRGMDGALAKIDLAIDFVDDDDMKLFAALTGTARIDLTGWCIGAEVEARIRAEIGNTLVGSGIAHGKISAGPRR